MVGGHSLVKKLKLQGSDLNKCYRDEPEENHFFSTWQVLFGNGFLSLSSAK
jgi:hypothetical protein